MGRIFGLSDSIFAFSMTLLVLSFALPVATSGGLASPAVVTNYLHGKKFFNAVYVYVLSFFIIAIWWRTHHMQFAYLRSYDRGVLQLNTIFLIFIAVMPFAAQVLNAASSPTGQIFFAGIQLGTGLSLAATWTYASGRGHLTPHLPKAWERYITWTTFSVPIVFALSIPLALAIGANAEYFWVAVGIAPYAFRRLAKS